MFNKDFFPTPTDLLEVIIPRDIKGKVILEPSAGKGDIVDFCRELGAEVIACELHEELAKIVEHKADRFLKRNFLEVESHEVSHIHSIYMNPPFSADEKHILHAWKIAPSGCHIMALCNWSTLDKDYSRTRKELLSVIENYGNSTNLGSAFDSADRTTGVEIGLINLYKPNSEGDFSGFFDDTIEEEFQENGIMSYNAIRDVVNCYVSACKQYDEVIKNAITMNNLIGKFGIGNITFTCTEAGAETSRTTFQKELQKKCWTWIFGKMDMGKYVTKSLKEDLNKFVEKQVNVPFTMKNIYKMFEIVVGTHEGRMNQALLEVFDRLTKHYDENRYNLEGWKTNSHYLVNQKFIMPHVVTNEWDNGKTVSCNYGGGNHEILNDLYKALSYLTGKPYDEKATLYGFYRHHTENMYVNVDRVADVVADLEEKGFSPVTVLPLGGVQSKVTYTLNPRKEFGQWYDWGFFEIKAFKKGTVHCKFKDESVWAKFNRRIGELKGFPLPEKL